MRKPNIFIPPLVVFFGVFLSYTANASGRTVYSASPSYDDVSAAVASADSGDTVEVPAGFATWDRQLVITKGLILRGAGNISTKIKSNYSKNDVSHSLNTENYLFAYVPANPELRKPFRITAFALDLDGKCGGVILSNNSGSTPSTVPSQIRIDHNLIENAYPYIGILVKDVWGVIDNNAISNCYNTPKFYGNQRASWDNEGEFTYGTANNMYFEDNIINIPSGSAGHSAGNGARYCVRYNTYNYPSTTVNLSSWLDAHGNQPSGVYGTMGVEVYGNKLIAPNRSGIFMAHRGGKALLFFNDLGDGPFFSAYANEEWGDAIDPTSCLQPEHVSDSYYWNNRRSGSLIKFVNGINSCSHSASAWQPNMYYGKMASIFPTHNNQRGYCYQVADAGTSSSSEPNWDATVVNQEFLDGTANWINVGAGSPIAEDVDFFNYDVGFDGSSGMGCGPLSVRPSTCAVGVGYWATEQNCDSINPDSVGAHPKVPISGTLYKCTASNVWTAYYTPYPYPHPLRVDDESVLPGLSFDATAGIITAPFMTNTDNTISQSILTLDPATGGRAVYAFNVPKPGYFGLSAELYAPNDGANSLFVNIDTEPTSPTMVWEIPVYAGFRSQKATWDRLQGLEPPKVWLLGTGVHHLIVRGREAGVKLRRIELLVCPPPPRGAFSDSN